MRRLWTELMAMLFPQRAVCHACGGPLVGAEELLCASCQRSLADNAFLVGRAQTVLSEECLFAASAYRYEGAAAALVKALKFGSDKTAAWPLAEGMAGIFAQWAPMRELDCCVAVPVHPRRQRRRGYNQADVLARRFCEITQLAYVPQALVRVHHRHSQVGLNSAFRRKNIRGAFAMSASGLAALQGKRVLLMDDVLTTGVTADECARVLRLGGADEVIVLTACRA